MNSNIENIKDAAKDIINDEPMGWGSQEAYLKYIERKVEVIQEEISEIRKKDKPINCGERYIINLLSEKGEEYIAAGVEFVGFNFINLKRGSRLTSRNLSAEEFTIQKILEKVSCVESITKI